MMIQEQKTMRDRKGISMESYKAIRQEINEPELRRKEKCSAAEFPEIQRVVVLGGSFNPPTIAHKRLLLEAVKAVKAEKGIFVPASSAYVGRKMKRNRHPEDTLPAALRLKMLLSMAKKEECLLADDCELCGKVTGFTYDVMKHIAEKYSDAEVYFLIGSDKIPVLPRWHRISDFLQNFRILVAKRNGEFPEQLIEKHQFLKKYRRSFQLFEIPENLDKISSSAFRELMRAGDEQAKSMVTGEVWELLKDEKEKQMQWAAKIKSEDNIYCFRGDYDFLSNFYPSTMEYEGLFYLNAEAAFQAQKCLSDEEKAVFCALPANKAKRMGRRVQLRSDWAEVKTGIMEQIVRCKFIQNQKLAEKLLQTGTKELIEGNTWGDIFWGVSFHTGEGENHLGRILMKIRGELAEK